MGNASYVTTGKPKTGGSVFLAPAGTTPPTDAVTALATEFKDLGYVSEDGVTNESSRESEEIKAWGGDVVLQPQTSKTDTFGMTLMETLNVEVLKAIYGDSNVTGTLETSIAVTVNSEELPYGAWVIDMITNGGYLKRVVLPYAKITEVSETTYKDDEAAGFEITVTAFPDDSGNTHYEYIQAPKSSTTTG